MPFLGLFVCTSQYVLAQNSVLPVQCSSGVVVVTRTFVDTGTYIEDESMHLESVMLLKIDHSIALIYVDNSGRINLIHSELKCEKYLLTYFRGCRKHSQPLVFP